MLVTWVRYKSITGDTTTVQATAEAALLDAQRLLEDELRRQLEKGTYTERLLLHYESRGQVVYPSAIPVISVSVPSGATVAGYAIVGATADSTPSFLADQPAYGTVTYVGGYDPAETVFTEADYLPRTIERAIAWAAYFDLNSDDVLSSAPSGATSVRLGDVAVTFGAQGALAVGTVHWPASVLRYKRRFV